MPIPFPHYPKFYDHPFGKFLKELPVDEACNPHPDKLEFTGAGQRWFIAYEGTNASARIAKLREAMRLAKPHIYAEMQNSSASETSARAVIYVLTGPNGVSPFGPQTPDQAMLCLLPGCVTQHMRKRPTITPDDGPDFDAKEETKEIPGCVQMPSYS